MLPILTKLHEDNKKRIIYSKVLTNKMTIVGWKLYKQDPRIHLGFIVYRLRRDFGFTWWEVANFTGIPVRNLTELYRKIKPLLDSDVLRILAKMDEEGELEAWREIPLGKGTQGHFVIHDYPAYYLKTDRAKKWREEPDIKLGAQSQKDYEDKITNKT